MLATHHNKPHYLLGLAGIKKQYLPFESPNYEKSDPGTLASLCVYRYHCIILA
jgi:hypothetical protein